MMGNDLSDAAKDLSNAADACAKNSEPDCGKDLMEAGNYLYQSGMVLFHGMNDCQDKQDEKLADSTCATDIETAATDIGTATVQVISAISVCKGGDAAKCTSAISQVVEELGVASKVIEQAVTDCGGASTQCAQDISDAATDLAKATDDAAKAVSDCTTKNDSDCTSDIMAAGQQLGLTTVAVTNSLKDCKSSFSEQVVIQ